MPTLELVMIVISLFESVCSWFYILYHECDCQCAPSLLWMCACRLHCNSSTHINIYAVNYINRLCSRDLLWQPCTSWQCLSNSTNVRTAVRRVTERIQTLLHQYMWINPRLCSERDSRLWCYWCTAGRRTLSGRVDIGVSRTLAHPGGGSMWLQRQVPLQDMWDAGSHCSCTVCYCTNPKQTDKLTFLSPSHCRDFQKTVKAPTHARTHTQTHYTGWCACVAESPGDVH